MTKPRIGAALLARIRDYAVEEPSFTCPFAAWELGVSQSAVTFAVEELLRMGTVRQIEPARGPYAAVYTYAPVEEPPPTSRRIFRELDASMALRADLAKATGEPVPLTGKAVGPSGRPGRDRRKQELGHRVKRQRQGT
jgi:hypothetical protein